MRKLLHSVAIAALLCAASTVACAQSQDSNNNTFSGAIAPAHPATTGPSSEPEGYRGVIPGHVAAPPHQDNAQAQTDDTAPVKNKHKHTAADTAQGADDQANPPRHKRLMSTATGNMTPRPGFEKHKTLTADDLKNIAEMTGVEVRLDKIPDNMTNAMHMPPHVYPLVSLPSPRRDGMLPSEYAAKQTIDRMTQQVNDAANVSPDAKKKAIDQAVQVMSSLASAMRIKRDVPPEIYQAMGVPSTYANETHDGAAKATDRLEEAIKNLQSQE